jgi:putative membrane protein
MGAADVVPGVSGGTMAFILGIYEELIRSIRAFDIEVGQPVFYP